MNKNIMDSPLVPGGMTTWVRDVSLPWLIKQYKKGYDIDVSRLFPELDYISVYRCNSSGYEYFLPAITGDSIFYEKLQKFDWYYMPWKWEHEIAINYFQNDQNILEIGCGQGAFLRTACSRIRLHNAVGLELNESALKNSDVNIINERVDAFASANRESFDVVCSFQVLEHIPDVHDTLASMLACLKVGGKLIVSVPNNNSFLRDTDSVLNMPPHHVGLWNEKSLRYLINIFSIKLTSIHLEPLQQYHIDSYIHSSDYSHLPNLFSQIKKKLDKLTGRYSKRSTQISTQKNSIVGHTVLAIFEKR